MNKGNQKNNWSFVCHLSYGDSGSVATVSSTGNRTNAVGIEPENASDLEIQYFLAWTAMARLSSWTQKAKRLPRNFGYRPMPSPLMPIPIPAVIVSGL